MRISDLTLEGRVVRLDPLDFDRLPELEVVAFDDNIWLYNTHPIQTGADLRGYVDRAVEERRRGVSLPFVTVHQPTNRVVGCTRFGNIDMVNRKIEIGWTWVVPEMQRTGVNTEAKYLMLSHAFETWDCVRVELKTDALNQQSRRGILGIGATEEGTLRHHMIATDGRMRDTVYFSILSEEWPAVKARLEFRMESHGM